MIAIAHRLPVQVILVKESLSFAKRDWFKSFVKNFALRPEIPFGRKMALHAIFHPESIHSFHPRHLAHFTMAAHTADSLVHVNRVVEVHIVFQSVNPDPAEGGVVLKTLSHRFKDLRVVPDLRVASHASARVGESGCGSSLNTEVTKTTIKPESLNMVLVTERNGLFRRDPDIVWIV